MTVMFFENGEQVFALNAGKCREPGVNPGRLRHCDGYKFQCHCSQEWEGGMRMDAEVRISVCLHSSRSGEQPPSGFSAKRRMRPARRLFRRDSLDAFILRSVEFEGVFFAA